MIDGVVLLWMLVAAVFVTVDYINAARAVRSRRRKR